MTEKNVVIALTLPLNLWMHKLVLFIWSFKLDLWKLPDIHVFYLKRLVSNKYFMKKIDTFVNFPINDLDLSKYVKNKNGQSYLYELYAVSNHYGGLGGGHYTAYAKVGDLNGLTIYCAFY